MVLEITNMSPSILDAERGSCTGSERDRFSITLQITLLLCTKNFIDLYENMPRLLIDKIQRPTSVQKSNKQKRDVR